LRFIILGDHAVEPNVEEPQSKLLLAELAVVVEEDLEQLVTLAEQSVVVVFELAAAAQLSVVVEEIRHELPVVAERLSVVVAVQQEFEPIHSSGQQPVEPELRELRQEDSHL
jgi:hypothetical protein